MRGRRRKAQKRLDKRLKAFAMNSGKGKHEQHKPGSQSK